MTTMVKVSNSDTYSSVEEMDYEPHIPYLSDTASHLLELSSISIRCDVFKKFPHVQLLGYVILTDQYGDTFKLLDESCSDNLLALGPCDDFLEIKLETSERNRPLLLSERFVLNLILKDKSEGTLIMEERFTWYFRGAVVYDKQQQQRFNTGRNGHVTVCYTIFRYALFATVKTSVKNKQEDDLHATVSGTIIATRNLWNGSIQRVLFDKLHSDKTMLASTGLCLHFPVQAYKTLEICAELKIDNEIILSKERELEFKIFENHLFPCKKVIEGVTWDIMMEVIMTNALIFDCDNKNSRMSAEEVGKLLECNKSSIMKRGEVSSENAGISDDGNSSMSVDKCNEFLERNESSIVECGKVSAESGNISKSEDVPKYIEYQPEPPKKKHRVNFAKYLVSDPDIKWVVPCPFPLVELFSISVCPYVGDGHVGDGDEGSPFPLCGTIRIADNFIDSESCIDCTLSPHEKIPMVLGSYCGPCFIVQLHLKDAYGCEISRGIMSWDYHNVDGWFGKFISSVVQGKNGFAAIHHCMFEFAVRAIVKVFIYPKDGYDGRVNGKICTSYFSQSYTPLHDEYFQSELFQRESTDSIKLGVDGELQLLKSLVVVPFDYVLGVELDLHRVVGNDDFQLKGKLFFQPANGMQVIEGTTYDVMVTLEQWLKGSRGLDHLGPRA